MPPAVTTHLLCTATVGQKPKKVRDDLFYHQTRTLKLIFQYLIENKNKKLFWTYFSIQWISNYEL